MEIAALIALFVIAYAIPVGLYVAYYKVSRGQTLPSPLAHAIVLILRPLAFIGRFIRWILRLGMIAMVIAFMASPSGDSTIWFTSIFAVLFWGWFELTLYFSHLLIAVLISNDLAKGAVQTTANTVANQDSMQELQASIAQLQETVNDLRNDQK